MSAAVGFYLVMFIAWSQPGLAAMPTRPPHPTIPTPQQQPPGPLGSQTLEPNQCGIGAAKTGIANISAYSTAGVLYVDTVRPAECSGEIVRWEVCYRYGSESPNVTFLVIREGASNYRVSTRYQLPLSGIAEQQATCEYIEAMETVIVERGDLIGFYTDSVRVAFAPHDNSILSQYTPLQSSGGILGVNTLQQNQLQPIESAIAPLIRLIMNSTEENSSTVMPTPSPTSRAPCPTNKGKGGFVSLSLFTSIVAVAVVMIFVLAVVVCVLLCCLCGLPCLKCCKLLQCCQRRKRAKVTKKVNSQVSQPIMDQSMQYNDMYVPKDPTEIITDGKKHKAYLFGNPAYDTPTSKLVRENVSPAAYDIPVSQVQRGDLDKKVSGLKTNLADLTCSEIDGEMEHTYETISGTH